MLLVGYTSRAKETVAEVYLPSVLEGCIDCSIFVRPQHETILVVVRCVAVVAHYTVEYMFTSLFHCLLNCSIPLNFDFIILSKFSTACVSPFLSARLRASIMLVALNESDRQTSIFNALLMGPNKQETAIVVISMHY